MHILSVYSQEFLALFSLFFVHLIRNWRKKKSDIILHCNVESLYFKRNLNV